MPKSKEQFKNLNKEDLDMSKKADVEKEPRPSVVLMYRENDVYRDAMPMVAEELQTKGYPVEIISFPAREQGKSEEEHLEEMKEDIRKQTKIFKDSVILTDSTTGSRTWPFTYDEEKELNLKAQIYLDDLSEEAVWDALPNVAEAHQAWKEEKKAAGAESLEASRNLFTALMTKVFEKEQPERIYIVPDDLTSHAPFGKYYTDLLNRFIAEVSPKDLKALEEKFSIITKFKDPKHIRPKSEEIKRAFEQGVPDELLQAMRQVLPDKDVKQPAELVRAWLESAGYSPDNISIAQHASDVNPADLEKDDVYIIFDRHAFDYPARLSEEAMSSTMDASVGVATKQKLLQLTEILEKAEQIASVDLPLPLDSLMETLQKKGYITVDPKAHSDSLAKKVVAAIESKLVN